MSNVQSSQGLQTPQSAVHCNMRIALNDFISKIIKLCMMFDIFSTIKSLMAKLQDMYVSKIKNMHVHAHIPHTPLLNRQHGGPNSLPFSAASLTLPSVTYCFQTSGWGSWFTNTSIFCNLMRPSIRLSHTPFGNP